MAPPAPMVVFLCDLTHDSQILVSDTIPINIGFIASYLKKELGASVEPRLFKYPSSVFSALKRERPSILALSNYSWNSSLSERVARFAKRLDSEILTVLGGPSFPDRREEQRRYLESRPEIDVYLEFEAERSFAALTERLLASEGDREKVFATPLQGGHFLTRSAPEAAPKLVSGEPATRIEDLDEIPSPYLTGLLDVFFDGRLTPFLETNRGCPFRCSFCHTGADYYNRIRRFSAERIRAEVALIGERCGELGICNLHLADTNFGMYKTDLETCEALQSSRRRFGWPTHIQATTGKNQKARVLEITEKMGRTLAVNMSVQSMDSDVLRNIRRSNISLDAYKGVNEALKQQGRPSTGELIIGLPGETRESFERGLAEVLEAGVTRVCMYSLMLLHGTEFQDPEFRREWGIDGRFRIVPLNFGIYEGEKVLDVEEVGVATKTLPFEDYLSIRALCLFVEVLYNHQPFEPVFRYWSGQGVAAFELVRRFFDARDRAPFEVRDLVEGFVQETEGELWPSREALVAHYQDEENYRKLEDGEVGGNLIFKYKALSLGRGREAWASFIDSVSREMLEERVSDPAARAAEMEKIGDIVRFCRCRLDGALDADAETGERVESLRYDIPAWLDAGSEVPMDRFRSETPRTYRFTFTERQMAERRDLFGRYGTHTNGISKIVARVTNVAQLFRRAEAATPSRI